MIKRNNIIGILIIVVLILVIYILNQQKNKDVETQNYEPSLEQVNNNDLKTNTVFQSEKISNNPVIQKSDTKKILPYISLFDPKYISGEENNLSYDLRADLKTYEIPTSTWFEYTIGSNKFSTQKTTQQTTSGLINQRISGIGQSIDYTVTAFAENKFGIKKSDTIKFKSTCTTACQ